MRVALIGLAALVASTSLALAETPADCKAEPEPVLMPLSEFEKLDLEKAKEVSNNTYKDIKTFQTGNTAYRECLARQSDAIKLKGDDATKADKATKQKLDEDHDKAIDREEKLAKNFNAMLDSLCAKGDKGSCP